MILSWVLSPIGRWVAIAAAGALAFWAFTEHYENKGAAEVKQQVQREKLEALENRNDVENRNNGLNDGTVRERLYDDAIEPD